MTERYRFFWIKPSEDVRGYNAPMGRDASFSMFGSLEDFHDKMSAQVGDKYNVCKSAKGHDLFTGKFYSVTWKAIKEAQASNPDHQFRDWCLVHACPMLSYQVGDARASCPDDANSEWWLVFTSPEDEALIMGHLSGLMLLHLRR